jgi:hypothetical protein
MSWRWASFGNRLMLVTVGNGSKVVLAPPHGAKNGSILTRDATTGSLRDIRADDDVAKLIAAAPKMLAALEAIIDASDKCQGHRNCDHDMTGWQLARAVLAEVKP